MSDYEVVTPRPVRKLIDGLAGKRAGYQRLYAQLSRDPCASELRAYRLAGPLEPIVCGVHLDRGYRLAFTMQPPEAVGQPTRVVILYVGLREPNHRHSDIWTILHDLFGVENPPVDHDRPPCCKGSVPEIKQDDCYTLWPAPSAFTRRCVDGATSSCRGSPTRSLSGGGS